MIKKFFRIAPTDQRERELHGPHKILRPIELVNRFRPGHGLVLADWDEDLKLGVCRAFGIVLSVDAPKGEVEALWCHSDIVLRPSTQGFQFWRNTKDWFGFAPKVVERYMLAALFAEAFPDSAEMDFGATVTLDAAQSGSSIASTPGFVYLLKSPYGYKIGKTVNIRQRTQLFAVKLPFPTELLHYARFDDYTSAERRLHQRFHFKRLEGEWFDLNESDIAYIQTLGDTPDGIRHQ